MLEHWARKGKGWLSVAVVVGFISPVWADDKATEPKTGWEEEAAVTVSDPLEGWNRSMFDFNDALYFNVLKPVSKGYAFVVPEGGRVAVKNFFHNLSSPIWTVNALLQGKGKQAGVELGRFVINTVIGGAGFFDVASEAFDMKPAVEDMGQTFGVWGTGEGAFLVWPFIGPSNVRDTVGRVGDTLMKPTTYFPDDGWARAGVTVFETVNNSSLKIGEYESLKKGALDPYIALREAYTQLRREKIRR
ncbi:MlaA family lipoprotein [Magnetococcales bacterium HHB-1]